MNGTSTPTRPTIETLAGLYQAAKEQLASAERAVTNVEEAAKRHGYTIEEVARAAAVTKR